MPITLEANIHITGPEAVTFFRSLLGLEEKELKNFFRPLTHIETLNNRMEYLKEVICQQACQIGLKDQLGIVGFHYDSSTRLFTLCHYSSSDQVNFHSHESYHDYMITNSRLPVEYAGILSFNPLRIAEFYPDPQITIHNPVKNYQVLRDLSQKTSLYFPVELNSMILSLYQSAPQPVPQSHLGGGIL